MIGPGRVVDALLEATVVGSYSSIGPTVRSRLERWSDPPRMDGSRVVVTGASSGIGRAMAERFAALGASVTLLVRNESKGDRCAEAIRAGVPRADLDVCVADLADLEALRSACTALGSRLGRVDVLVHNAGSLHHPYLTNSTGVELTVATHVLAPWVMTEILSGALTGGRVITMSSGGAYLERFDLGLMEMGPDGFNGVTAYSRAKRAQMVLTHEWTRRHPSIRFACMHPGWVATPGITEALPGFMRLMRPILRSPAQGADTAVWLGGTALGEVPPGAFWLDRRRRGEYRLPWTRPRSDERDGDDLWRWCQERGR